MNIQLMGIYVIGKVYWIHSASESSSSSAILYACMLLHWLNWHDPHALEQSSPYFLHRSVQAPIQDQISTSPSPRTVNPPRGCRIDIITYIINNITIKGNYEPNLLLEIINVYL